MIEIDGSYGEGGGQIIRTSVALSAVTGEPVRIFNIRKSRPKPGLAAQHAQAVRSLAQVSSAKVEGANPGSTEVTFMPGVVRGGGCSIDIGTAGSITLLMQCLLPALVCAKEETILEIQGGTDVQWSPTIDYFKNVFLPALGKFGAQAELLCRQRGYYPRGAGQVTLKVKPVSLRPAEFEMAVPEAAPDEASDTADPAQVLGISHCSNIPEHVAVRQAESASQALRASGFQSRIEKEILKLPSTGSGITLWQGHKGGSALGERGVRAEDVGREAAQEIIPELRSNASVDVHLADQLVPYLAIAGGSYTVREVSRHAMTNIWTIEQFLGERIEVQKLPDGLLKVSAPETDKAD